MCDYSLHAVKTRPARVDDKLTIRMFGWSTRGFAASEDKSVAVCLSPFLELGQQATVLQLPVTHEGVKVAKPKEAKAS